MTTEQSTTGLQAALLCCGYSVGYYTDADIERWAERQIAASDEPPLAMIDLAMLRGMYPIDVMNLLRSLGGALSPSATIEARIGFLGLLYGAKRISLKTALNGLLALIHDEGVTGDQRSMIYCLDDGYDLVLERTYGTVSEVEAAFHSFALPYADSLKAQGVEMLGETIA